MFVDLLHERVCFAARSNDELLVDITGSPGNHVDEMAVMFETVGARKMYADALLRNGWEQLAEPASDVVRTTPIPSWYVVSYEWYVRDGFDWRYELMYIESGFSPLHGSYLFSMPGVPVHASFKCEGLEEMAVASKTLTNASLPLAQKCKSEYGEFSYHLSDRPAGDTPMYLKPRVNLRDAQ